MWLFSLISTPSTDLQQSLKILIFENDHAENPPQIVFLFINITIH